MSKLYLYAFFLFSLIFAFLSGRGYQKMTINDHKEIVSSMERENRMAVVHSLAALRLLEKGNVSLAKEILIDPISSYYLIYERNAKGSSRESTLKAIEDAREEIPELDAALSKVKKK
jgi:hypothetical protein